MIWLASYPKTGSTWMRAFLSNYLQDRSTPASINRLIGRSAHTERHLFDDIMGIPSSDLTAEELPKLRSIFHQQLNELGGEYRFIKAHDAFRSDRSEQSLFDGSTGAKAIYLIRNPVDVVPSFSHHLGVTLDETIAFMGDPSSRLNGGNGHFDQHLGTWSEHVTGWTAQEALDLLLLRYEDMIANPQKAFSSVVEFSGMDYDDERLNRAIALSRFEVLKQNEAIEDFSEKPPTAASFFRKGKAGDGRKSLTSIQLSRIITNHESVMRQFDYL